MPKFVVNELTLFSLKKQTIDFIFTQVWLQKEAASI